MHWSRIKSSVRQTGLCGNDEQHRFGVETKKQTLDKRRQEVPHVLVDDSHPIPRTLAMTLWRSDVSVIDEMPPGRKPIQNSSPFWFTSFTGMGLLKSRLKPGRQVYVVYPLIEESEKWIWKIWKMVTMQSARIFLHRNTEWVFFMGNESVW